MVTGSAFGVRDMGWIKKHLPTDGSVSVQELTSARATINLAGPLSRQILEQVADGDVGNQAFPYMTARELRIGFAPVLALRVTYLGELGWELHLPTEYAAHVYELLWAAGRDLGLADAGYRAIDSLRLEKRYLYWGADITPDYTPYEAGLGFAVSLKKKSDFIGRAALEKAKAAGPARKLITLLVDADVQLYGGEAIRRETARSWASPRRPAGATRSARPSPSATCPPRKRATPTTRSRPSPAAMPPPASTAPPSIRNARRSWLSLPDRARLRARVSDRRGQRRSRAVRNEHDSATSTAPHPPRSASGARPSRHRGRPEPPAGRRPPSPVPGSASAAPGPWPWPSAAGCGRARRRPTS